MQTVMICRIPVATHFSALISFIVLDDVAVESRFIGASAFSVRQPLPRKTFLFRALRSKPARTLCGASAPGYRRSSKPLRFDAAGSVISGALKYVSDSRQTRMRSNVPFVFLQLRKCTKPPSNKASFNNCLTSRRVRAIVARGPY